MRWIALSFCLTLLTFFLSGCGSKEPALPVPEQAYDIQENDIPATETEAENDTNGQTGETEPSLYEPEEELIDWGQVKELETEDYYIVAVQEEKEDGGTVEYPQIVLKEGKEIFCGTEHINGLLRRAFYVRDYNILYADRYYICIWRGIKETGKTDTTYVINLQCPVTESDVTFKDWLFEIQDDNDYRDAPWPSNGITLSLDAILEEIENGNYYTDEAGYTMYQEAPEAFIASVRRQFEEIGAGGYEEAYWARNSAGYSKKAYRMYIRDGRVGFYIHPIDVWKANEKNRFYDYYEPIDTDRDFRIEVAYDWLKDAPVYHMPYEVYGEQTKSETYGTFYYPQIKGLDENITSALNAAMKQDLDENLVYMDLDEWNEIMKPYGYEQYWDELPPVNNPMVTYQTEKYLCIRQELITDESERLRFAEAWKRYHVYDLETGESLKLGDTICVDEEFVTWLKEEKKAEATHGYEEGMESINDPAGEMKEELDYYPADLLLDILEDAEFWLKDGNLYIRIPRYHYYDRFDAGYFVYYGGGTGYPDYIYYYEVRIDLTDLQEFLRVEPWGE